MSPEELRTIIENVLSDKIKFYPLYLILAALIGFGSAFFMEYFKRKGENLATKQDVEEITAKIENIKSNIQANYELESQKRQLKYSALISSLKIIDAHFSNFLIPLDGSSLSKQYASVSEARECQNNLILTCDNPETIKKFIGIISPRSPLSEKQIGELILSLNEYRNLVRTELGFGNDIELDSNFIWLAKVNFEKQ